MAFDLQCDIFAEVAFGAGLSAHWTACVLQAVLLGHGLQGASDAEGAEVVAARQHHGRFDRIFAQQALQRRPELAEFLLNYPPHGLCVILHGARLIQVYLARVNSVLPRI